MELRLFEVFQGLKREISSGHGPKVLHFSNTKTRREDVSERLFVDLNIKININKSIICVVKQKLVVNNKSERI